MLEDIETCLVSRKFNGCFILDGAIACVLSDSCVNLQRFYILGWRLECFVSSEILLRMTGSTDPLVPGDPQSNEPSGLRKNGVKGLSLGRSRN